MSLKLDRHYGTFSHIGAIGLENGRVAAEAFSKAFFKKDNPVEINSDELIYDYNQLVDKYNSLQANFQALEKQNSELQYQNDMQSNEIVNLTTENTELQNRVQQVEFENKIFKDKFNVQKVITDELLQDQKAELKKSANRCEFSFATIQGRSQVQTKNLEYLLKTAHTQNKINSDFILQGIAKNLFSKELYEQYYHQVIEQHNLRDFQEGNVTYSEALNWLKVFNPKNYEKVTPLVLKLKKDEVKADKESAELFV